MMILNIGPTAMYIDPTAITTSLVSASSIIIALGASASVLLGRATTLSAAASARITKLPRGFVNAFCVVENGGKSVEQNITLKKKR